MALPLPEIDADGESGDLSVVDVEAFVPFSALPEPVRATLGRPKLPGTVERISIRASTNVVRAFQATGEGWHARMAQAISAAEEASKRLRGTGSRSPTAASFTRVTDPHEIEQVRLEPVPVPVGFPPAATAWRRLDRTCEPVWPFGSVGVVDPRSVPVPGDRVLVVLSSGAALFREVHRVDMKTLDVRCPMTRGSPQSFSLGSVGVGVVVALYSPGRWSAHGSAVEPTVDRQACSEHDSAT